MIDIKLRGAISTNDFFIEIIVDDKIVLDELIGRKQLEKILEDLRMCADWVEYKLNESEG